MWGKSVYVLLRVSGIYFLNIYRPIYRNIRFLNHQIFVSVTALKILYRSGSILYFNHRIWKKTPSHCSPALIVIFPWTLTLSSLALRYVDILHRTETKLINNVWGDEVRLAESACLCVSVMLIFCVRVMGYDIIANWALFVKNDLTAC